jgi:hypothetical protein
MRLEKYWDKLVSAPFIKKENGEMHFRPWGIFGSAYILDSGEIENKLRRERKYYFIISMTLLLLFLFVPAIAIISGNLLIAILFLHDLRNYRLVQHFSKTTDDMTFLQRLGQSYAEIPWPILILGEICCVPFICAFFFLLHSSLVYPQIEVFTLKLIGIFILFGAVFLIINFAIWCKIKNPRQSKLQAS